VHRGHGSSRVPSARKPTKTCLKIVDASFLGLLIAVGAQLCKKQGIQI